VRLADRVAVVTGGSRGIGRAVALAFGREGARVVLSYLRNQQAARAVVAAIGEDRALAVQANVARPEDVQRLGEAAVQRFGRIDIWVNNAGADVLTGAGRALSAAEQIDLLLQVDVKGTVHGCQVAAAVMQRQSAGKIINVAWDHIFAGLGTHHGALYALAKGAVWAYSKSLARSLSPAVRVNVIAPGWIETEWGQTLEPQQRRRIASATPLQRWGRPEDVAAAAVFLASADADFITGQTLVVNGGVVMW
jgi:3-oxoacyl-[acyl-carrier protein] reductase